MAQFMNKFTFVTSNANKLNEARIMLNSVGIEIEGAEINFVELQLNTQEEIVKNKLEQAYNLLKRPVIVDDTGVYISKFDNFPGVITKTLVDSIGIEGIVRLIEDGDEACFKTVIGFRDGDTVKIFDGTLNGNLTKIRFSEINPKAPISSIFIPIGQDKTLSELGEGFLNGNSHRSRALRRMADYLKNDYAKK